VRPILATLVLLAPLGALLCADEPQLRTVEKLPTARHGTAVEFVATPVDAAKLAAEQKKLALILHVSGYFEDPDCT
jgi:hypothetical protein